MHETLSALVIHDIKNSLALLEIDLEQLNHHSEVPEEGQRAYRRCIELKNRLISFLTLYKYDQSGLKPILVNVELTDFIEDLVSNCQSVMMSANHHGHVTMLHVNYQQIKSSSGAANFDENLLELALESALNNALRYARRRVDILFEQDAGELRFKVLDDGVGVGVEDDLMQRNVVEKSSSTGLGLALCKAVAESHGSGFVSLEAVAGGGTLFTLTLRSIR